jgi:hypothetical protein
VRDILPDGGELGTSPPRRHTLVLTPTDTEMFTGAGRERKVTMRGKAPAALDKTAALEAARREREAREALRRRTDAATRLQATWRRFAGARRWRTAQLAAYDAKVGDVRKLAVILAASGKAFALPLPAVVGLNRALVLALGSAPLGATPGAVGRLNDAVALTLACIQAAPAATALGLAAVATGGPPPQQQQQLAASFRFGAARLVELAAAAQVARNRAALVAPPATGSSQLQLLPQPLFALPPPADGDSAAFDSLCAGVERLVGALADVPPLAGPLCVSLAVSSPVQALLADAAAAQALESVRAAAAPAPASSTSSSSSALPPLRHPLVQTAVAVACRALQHAAAASPDGSLPAPLAAAVARSLLPIPRIVGGGGAVVDTLIQLPVAALVTLCQAVAIVHGGGGAGSAVSAAAAPSAAAAASAVASSSGADTPKPASPALSAPADASLLPPSLAAAYALGNIVTLHRLLLDAAVAVAATASSSPAAPPPLPQALASALVAVYGALVEQVPAALFAPPLPLLAPVAPALQRRDGGGASASSSLSAAATSSRYAVDADSDDDGGGGGGSGAGSSSAAASSAAAADDADDGDISKQADKNADAAVALVWRRMAYAALSAAVSSDTADALAPLHVVNGSAAADAAGSAAKRAAAAVTASAGVSLQPAGPQVTSFGLGNARYTSAFGGAGGGSVLGGRPAATGSSSAAPGDKRLRSPSGRLQGRVAGVTASAARGALVARLGGSAVLADAALRRTVEPLWAAPALAGSLLQALLLTAPPTASSSASSSSSSAGGSNSSGAAPAVGSPALQALSLVWTLHTCGQLAGDAAAAARRAGAAGVPEPAADSPSNGPAPAAAAAVSDALASLAPVLPHAWAALPAYHAPGSPSTLSTSPSGRAYLSALCAFTTGLHAALAAVDDIELRERGLPLPVEGLRGVVAWAKAALYWAAWADPAAGDTPLRRRHPLVLALIAGTTALLNECFDRHSRWPLLAADADWLWPPLPASELSVDVILGIAEEPVADEALSLAEAAAAAASATNGGGGGGGAAVPQPAAAAAAAAAGGGVDDYGMVDEGGDDDQDYGEDDDGFDGEPNLAEELLEIAGGGGRGGRRGGSNVRLPYGGAAAMAAGGVGGGGSGGGAHAQLNAPQYVGTKGVRQARAQMVLTTVPFVIPFATRVALFTALRDRDRAAHLAAAAAGGAGMHALLGFAPPPKISVTVRRAHLVDDAFRAVSEIASLPSGASGSRLKDPLSISFVNAEGLPEAGIDGGGLLKEFIDCVVREAFTADAAGAGAGVRSLFCATPDHALYPNPAARYATGAGSASASPPPLARYEFAGRLLGKALYEGILVEPRFAGFFLRKLLGRPNGPDDLGSLDPGLHRSLASLKRLPPGDLAAAGLCFEVTEEDAAGRPTAVPLVPGGGDLGVSPANVGAYIRLVAHHRLNAQIAPQVAAFLRGFRDLVPVPWLRMFGPRELQTLLGGADADIDLGDLRAHTVYSGGFHDSQPYVASFWRVLGSLPQADLRAFLAFTTSCSRPPLLGFGALKPSFGVTRVLIDADDDRLPSAGTCFNALRLPVYSSEAVLRQKLLLAIHAGAGFELS